MHKFILAVVLFLMPVAVMADVASGTFVPPTQREDGTALSVEEIGGYNVYLDGVEVSESPLPPNATSFTLTLSGGPYNLTITTFDVQGRESLPSPVIPLSVLSAPNPPSNVTVTISIE